MKDKIKNIKEKMFMSKLEQEAKTIPRKDLEEIWVGESYKTDSKEYVKSDWAFWCVLFGVVAFFSIFSIWTIADTYEGSEIENYITFSKDVCEREELGKFRFFLIEEETITVKCYGGNYEIYKRS